MLPIATDGVAWSVSLSVTTVSPATAEPIVMPFDTLTQLGPRSHVLSGVRIATREGTILRVKRTCQAVVILKVTQQGGRTGRMQMWMWVCWMAQLSRVQYKYDAIGVY